MGFKETFQAKAASLLLGKDFIEKAAVVQAQSTVDNAYLQNIYQWLFNNQPISILDRPYEYVGAYSSNNDVYTCVDKITKKIVSTPIIIYEVVPGKEAKYLQYKALRYSSEPEAIQKAAILKAQSLREVNQKDIDELILNPNPQETQSEFFTQLAGFFLLSGNGYTYLNGPVPGKYPWSEMYVLPSQFMEIISGGMFLPVKGYRVNYTYMATNNIVPFPVEQVTHIKTFNPEFNVSGSQLYGMSPLRSLLLTLAMSKEGKQELVKQAKNGGTLGMLSPDGPGVFLGPDQQKDLNEKLQQIKSSNKTGERLFPSGGPLKYTQIGLPSTELQLIELLGVTREDIYRAFHIPLTYSDQKASTYDNLTLSAKQFIYDAVMPIGDMIEDKLLNRTICAAVNRKTGKKYVAHYDYQSLPEMQADMTKLSEWLDKSWEITPNERREAKGYGRSPLPELDEYYIPSGLRNIKDAAITDDAFTEAQEE